MSWFPALEKARAAGWNPASSPCLYPPIKAGTPLSTHWDRRQFVRGKHGVWGFQGICFLFSCRHPTLWLILSKSPNLLGSFIPKRKSITILLWSLLCQWDKTNVLPFSPEAQSELSPSCSLPTPHHLTSSEDSLLYPLLLQMLQGIFPNKVSLGAYSLSASFIYDRRRRCLLNVFK